MLGRSGLYARVHTDEHGHAIFILLIKGNDIHSGNSPTVDDIELAKFLDQLRKLYAEVGPENRVVYVLYPNVHAFQRDAGVSMTEPTGFEQPGRQHTFADDGFPACGSFTHWMTFMARERYMRDYNFSRMARQEPSRALPIYEDLHGNQVTVQIPFDPEHDAAYVDFMRGVYLNMHNLCALYNLRMTKPMFARNQKHALAAAEARYAEFRPSGTTTSASSLPISPTEISASSVEPSTLPVTSTKTLPAAAVPVHHSEQTRSKGSVRKKPSATTSIRQGALRIQQPANTYQEKASAAATDDDNIYEVSLILNHRFNRIVSFSLFDIMSSIINDLSDWFDRICCSMERPWKEARLLGIRG